MILNIDRRTYKDVVGDVKARGAREVSRKKVRARTARNLIAGLLVVEIEMDGRHSDSSAKFRRYKLRTESSRLEDTIENMERGLIR